MAYFMFQTCFSHNILKLFNVSSAISIDSVQILQNLGKLNLVYLLKATFYGHENYSSQHLHQLKQTDAKKWTVTPFWLLMTSLAIFLEISSFYYILQKITSMVHNKTEILPETEIRT